MNGYIQLPRTLYESSAWKSATLEQKGFFTDLCFIVAHGEHSIKTKFGDIKLKPGQMMMTQRNMSEYFGITRSKLRCLLENMVKLNFVSIENCTTTTTAQSTAQETTNRFKCFTLLTINHLQDDTKNCTPNNTTSNTTNTTAHKTEEGNRRREQNPPLKSPPHGGDFSSDDGVAVSKKSLTKQVRERRKELHAEWKEALEVEGGEAKRFEHYMPWWRTYLCSDQSRIKEIIRHPSTPRVADPSLTMMPSFFELHMLDFVIESGLSYKLRPEEFANIARDLMMRSKEMNLAEILLFFYFLVNGDPIVCNSKWESGIDRIKISKAFTMFTKWCSSET